MTTKNWVPATGSDWVAIGGSGYFPLNQTWQWGEAKRMAGSAVERFVIDGRVGVQFEWRRGVAWAAAAPVGECGRDVVPRLEDLAKQLRRPMLVSPTAPLHGGHGPFATGLFHSGTVLFDLSGGDEVIRSRFRKTWRNSLSKALRTDTEIVDGSLSELMPLLRELAARKGFDLPYDEPFIRNVLSVFREGAVIRLARLEGRVVGGRLDLRVGATATSFLSATTLEGRSVNAASLLSWDAMVRHHAAGAIVYDFGGVSYDRSGGPSGHKLSMGGQLLEFPGTYLIGGGLRAVAIKALMRIKTKGSK